MYISLNRRFYYSTTTSFTIKGQENTQTKERIAQCSKRIAV